MQHSLERVRCDRRRRHCSGATAKVAFPAPLGLVAVGLATLVALAQFGSFGVAHSIGAHSADFEPSEGHVCIHDDIAKADDLLAPLKGQAHLDYGMPGADSATNRRRQRGVGNDDEYQPIRITPYYYNIDSNVNAAITKAKADFIKSYLIPTAVARFKEMLRVIPVQGNLGLTFPCNGLLECDDGRRRCSMYNTDMFCGGTVKVPRAHLGKLTVYSECSETGTVDDYGGGVPDSDFILYVTAVTTNCAASTIAYANWCSQDQNDRPIAGYVNLCPSKVDPFAANVEDQVIVALHEITHALGFSAALFPYFHDSTGAPRTFRDRFGSPSAIHASYQNTVKTAVDATLGKSVSKVVTERVVTELARHSNCSSITGAELEDGGGASTAGSHWEERVFNNEYMAGSLKARPVISAMTLALLEDSNWYRANYAAASTLTWGRKAGCDFFSKKCISTNADTGELQTSIGDPRYFCVSNYNQQGFLCPLDQAIKGTCGIGCTWDGGASAGCPRVRYNTAIPSNFQYFGDTNVGGNQPLGDYCSYWQGLNNGVCSTGSRCIMERQRFVQSLYPMCYAATCTVDNAGTRIVRFDVGGTIDCAVAGDVKTMDDGRVYVCPNVADYCPQGDCPNDCGAGVCVEGLCRCSDGTTSEVTCIKKTYGWVVVQYGACDAPCNNGTKLPATYECHDLGSGELAPSSRCKDIAPPTTAVSCNPEPCAIHVVKYGPCTATCGNGISATLLECREPYGNSTVQDGFCAADANAQLLRFVPCSSECREREPRFLFEPVQQTAYACIYGNFCVSLTHDEPMWPRGWRILRIVGIEGSILSNGSVIGRTPEGRAVLGTDDGHTWAPIDEESVATLLLESKVKRSHAPGMNDGGTPPSGPPSQLPQATLTALASDSGALEASSSPTAAALPLGVDGYFHVNDKGVYYIDDQGGYGSSTSRLLVLWDCSGKCTAK
eukprot:Opistho-2@12427